uniref:CDKN2A interacting protein N-terminal like n=1 Tax=Laticauda laticaudata TaxID=8630 RepID=A0A8C5SWC4_LATLA
MVKGDNKVAPDPEFPEQFRSYSENEKHWQARRAFILRNSPLEGGEAPTPLRLDQLLSLSMVWANHLFLGCRYRLLVPSLARPPKMFRALQPGPAGKDRSCRPMLHLGNARAGEGSGEERAASRLLSFNACTGIARYSKDLLEKVTEMADGIEVEDVPHFTTRDELIKSA